VHFSMVTLMAEPGFCDLLKRDVYGEALIPSSSWLDSSLPDMPEISLVPVCILVTSGKESGVALVSSDAGKRQLGLSDSSASQHSCSIAAAVMLFRYERWIGAGSQRFQRLRKLDKLKNFEFCCPDWSEIPAWLKRGRVTSQWDDRNWGLRHFQRAFGTLFRQFDRRRLPCCLQLAGEMLRAGRFCRGNNKHLRVPKFMKFNRYIKVRLS